MNEYYQSPLSQRYASKEMQALFSNDKKFKTWRRLWIALAQSEQELGLDITDEQIENFDAFDVKKYAEFENYISGLAEIKIFFLKELINTRISGYTHRSERIEKKTVHNFG